MAILAINGRINSGKDLVTKIIQFLTAEDNMKQWFEEEPLQALNDWNGNFDGLGTFKNKKFADKLKDIICIVLGCSRKDLENQEFKEKELGEEWNRMIDDNHTNPITYETFKKYGVMQQMQYRHQKLTPRLVMQSIGTDLFRNQLHPSVWVNSLMNEYKLTELTLLEIANVVLKYGKCDDLFKFPNWIISDMRFPNEADAIKKKGGLLIRINRTKKYNTGNKIIDETLSKVKDAGLVEHESEISLDNYKFDEIIDNNGTIPELIEKVRIILKKYSII